MLGCLFGSALGTLVALRLSPHEQKKDSPVFVSSQFSLVVALNKEAAGPAAWAWEVRGWVLAQMPKPQEEGDPQCQGSETPPPWAP